MSRFLRPRWILVGVGVLALVLLAAVAFVALEPPTTKPSAEGGPACSPRPCTAPGGFELYLSNLSLSGGRVTMDVSFKNRTQPGGFEAVTYRHTSPADFELHAAGGNNKPLFDAACPHWEEARVERGATAANGPDKLCFSGPSSGLSGAELRWTPDEGVFPIAGSISLG